MNVLSVPSKNPVKMMTPRSKTRSISNRALVLAALGKGTCRLILKLRSHGLEKNRDRTGPLTGKDRKFPGLVKVLTAVQSTVFRKLED